MVAAKADLGTVDPGSAWTAFHWTCFNNHPDCTEALIRAGCDTSLRDKSGKTGRDFAQAEGHTAVLERLAALKKTEANRKKKEQKRRKKEQERLAAEAEGGAEEYASHLSDVLLGHIFLVLSRKAGDLCICLLLCNAFRRHQMAISCH